MPLILAITAVIISVVIAGTALLLTQKINNAQKEVSKYTNYENFHINITPKPTKAVTPTPRSATPTPIPTLNEEQQQEIKDTFQKSFEDKGIEIPQDMLDDTKRLNSSTD